MTLFVIVHLPQGPTRLVQCHHLHGASSARLVLTILNQVQEAGDSPPKSVILQRNSAEKRPTGIRNSARARNRLQTSLPRRSRSLIERKVATAKGRKTSISLVTALVVDPTLVPSSLNASVVGLLFLGQRLRVTILTLTEDNHQAVATGLKNVVQPGAPTSGLPARKLRPESHRNRIPKTRLRKAATRPKSTAQTGPTTATPVPNLLPEDTRAQKTRPTFHPQARQAPANPRLPVPNSRNSLTLTIPAGKP